MKAKALLIKQQMKAKSNVGQNLIFKPTLMLSILLGVLSYLNTFFISQFDSAEEFNVIVLLLFIVQFIIYWCAFIKLKLFIDGRSPVLTMFNERWLLAFCFLVFTVLFSITLNSLLKLGLIVVFNNHPNFNWLHVLNYGMHGLIHGGLVLVVQMYLVGQQTNYQQTLDLQVQQSQLAQTELAFLQSQLNPHFMFNNLNTLHSLIYQDQQLAADYLLHLSSYLRQSFSVNQKQLIPLMQELENLAHYIAIVQMRFLAGLEFSIDKSELKAEQMVPSSALVELIENAIKHNQATDNEPLNININVFNDGVSVTNSVNPKKVEDSNGVGLANLSSRCVLLTGRTIGVKQSNKEFSVCVPIGLEHHV